MRVVIDAKMGASMMAICVGCCKSQCRQACRGNDYLLLPLVSKGEVDCAVPRNARAGEQLESEDGGLVEGQI